MHNLFGDTNAVKVVMDTHAANDYRLSQPEQGESVDERLRYVNFSAEAMLEATAKS